MRIFKTKYILLPVITLLCNMYSEVFTQEQETKIKKIVVNEQNERLKLLIKAYGKIHLVKV